MPLICSRFSGCTEPAQYPTGTPGIYACFKHRPSAKEIAAILPGRSVPPVKADKVKAPPLGVKPEQQRAHKKLLSQCVYCGVSLTPDNYTRDHVIPLSRGGSTQRENIAPCCYDCNHLKGPLTASEFLAVRSDPKALKEMIRKVHDNLPQVAVDLSEIA